MYPQTPEEVKRTNQVLAVLYGLLMLVAFAVSFAAMFGGMFMFSPEMFGGFSSPRELVASGHALYLIEEEKVPDFSAPKTLLLIHYYDGKTWREGPKLERGWAFCPWSGGMAAFTDEKLILLKGAEIAGSLPNPLPPNSQIVNYGKGLAAVSLGRPGFFKVKYLDAKLDEQWTREVKMPEGLSDECSFLFYPVVLRDRLWLFWQKGNRLFYAPFSDEALGEVDSAPFYVWKFKPGKIPGRAVFMVREPTPNEGFNFISVWELGPDREWKSLGKLSAPKFSYDLVGLTEYRNSLHLVLGGFNSVWKRFESGKWKDVTEEMAPPQSRAFKPPFSGMFDSMFKLWGWSTAAMGILPALVLVIAHFHFRAKKNPRLVVNDKEFELASLGRRTIAFAIDLALSSLPPAVLAFLVMKRFESLESPFAFFQTMLMWFGTGLLFLAIPFVYFFVLEFLWGKTLGKLLLGIRVVKVDGEPCNFTASLLRNLVRMIEGLFYYLPTLVSMAATEKYQRLGDLVADTMVVREPKR